MPRAKAIKRKQPDTVGMPDPLAEDPPAKKQKTMDDDTNLSIDIHEDSVIKKTTKKKATTIRKDLKTEILAKYNEVTGKSLTKYGQIEDPYTIVETYLMTDTGLEKGLRYAHFSAIFNEKITSVRTKWMNDLDEDQIDESIATKWNVPLVQSQADIDTALAVVFIMKHCYDKERCEFFVNPLNFGELRETVKYEVIRIMKVWQIEGSEELENHMGYPRFIKNMTKHAREMHQIGVSSVTLNFDTKGLLAKEDLTNVF